MQLEERAAGNVVIVKVSGEITLKKNRSTLLHDKVRGLVQQGHTRVLIDLADVSYVDSAGLGELVQANSTAKNFGGSIKLFSPTSRLRELMVVTRLTAILGVYDDEAQALASYGSQDS
jgi:anti-sigma B factor antagonist